MKELCAWTGRLLSVDLTTGLSEVHDTREYLPDAVGGRALGAALAWEMLRPGIAPLDPENPLMFLAGPLSDTSAPSAGRTTVCTLAPQSYPIHWFTRGSMGGDWAHMLKRAGYDGVVIVGRSPRPVYLSIRNAEVELCDAQDLWGQGIMATQETLRKRHGDKAQVATIGPAGESLSAISVIGTNEGSAVGQGGFGAVMGSKNLKAAVVQGSGRTRIAHREAFVGLTKAISRDLVLDYRNRASGGSSRPATYGARQHRCSSGCVRGCVRHYEGVPGQLFPDRTYAGVVQCTSGRFSGAEGYYWDIGFEAGFELNMLANDWGINHWDLMKGLFPWIGMCHRAGLMNDIGGRQIDLDDPHFWYEVLESIATRRGPMAEVVADGGRQAIARTGLLPDDARQLYTGWGYANHWDGRGPRGNNISYPFWLASALLWMTESRDPMGSTHGYVQDLTGASPLRFGILTWDQLKSAAERIYGRAEAGDPYSDYEGKAEPALFHARRSMLKDSLPGCDRVFPRLFSSLTEDGLARVDGIEGPDLDARLFSLATGIDVDTPELERLAERALTLERAQQIRDLRRTREMDNQVLDFFCDTEEERANPVLGEKRRAEPEPLYSLADEFYRLHGWDPQSGVPTPEHLRSLGLEHVVEAL